MVAVKPTAISLPAIQWSYIHSFFIAVIRNSHYAALLNLLLYPLIESLQISKKRLQSLKLLIYSA